MTAHPTTPARRLHPAWVGSGIVLTATGLCALLERHFGLANLVLVYTAGVIVMALQYGRAATLSVSVASIALLDFIFVPPRWGFKPTDPQYYFTFAVMAVMGWLVNELAQRVRQEAERSTARARQAQALALERAEYQARSTQAQIESATERQRNTLLASISHDFRTPLTTIIGAATSLREQEGQLPPAARRELLSSVEHEARRLHALSSNLLELAGLQRGAVQPQLQWCPADELVAEARAAVGERLDRLMLQVEVDAHALVWCDPQLMQQLLVNLLDNVARHTPQGTSARIGVVSREGVCEITVVDRRPADLAMADPVRGAGGSHRELGLSICSEIARLHGGQLQWVDDGGRRVTVHLPQPAVPQAALEDW